MIDSKMGGSSFQSATAVAAIDKAAERDGRGDQGKKRRGREKKTEETTRGIRLEIQL